LRLNRVAWFFRKYLRWGTQKMAKQLQVTCPECSAKLKLPAGLTTGTVKCPTCGTSLALKAPTPKVTQPQSTQSDSALPFDSLPSSGSSASFGQPNPGLTVPVATTRRVGAKTASGVSQHSPRDARFKTKSEKSPRFTLVKIALFCGGIVTGVGVLVGVGFLVLRTQPTKISTSVSPTELLPRDTSTPEKALLGHWVSITGLEQDFFRPDGTKTRVTAKGDIRELKWSVISQDQASRNIKLEVSSVGPSPSPHNYTFTADYDITENRWQSGLGGDRWAYVDTQQWPTEENLKRKSLPISTEDPVGTPSGNSPTLSVPIGRTPIELPVKSNSIGMQFKLIPAGTFMMGKRDEDPYWGDSAHEVTLTDPFHMGVYEVTQRQYEQVMGVNRSKFKGADHPVDGISWNDAVKFCRKLSELPAEKAAGNVYRLPTEAEWEYACRAGTTTKFFFGDDWDGLSDYAWCTRNTLLAEKSVKGTRAVGGKLPNAWGLYDMLGNVAEWCHDRHGDYPSGAVTDPTGPGPNPDPSPYAQRTRRVFRGGGWQAPNSSCESAKRQDMSPELHFDWTGLRVCLSSSGK
jgi:formylglycine-generating enzyme required for sulfatase activity/ribosomal protein L37AE/L43A